MLVKEQKRAVHALLTSARVFMILSQDFFYIGRIKFGDFYVVLLATPAKIFPILRSFITGFGQEQLFKSLWMFF